MSTIDEIQRGLKAIRDYSTDELATKIATSLLTFLANQPSDCRADTLERALWRLEDAVHTQRVRGNGVDQEVLAAQIAARDLLTDQPAQDDRRGATPENVNDYLDGHDNGLNVGYRQGWNDALERAAKLAREWGEFGLASAIRRERRNLQPDQPADAGEPSCCARTPGDTL
jgi:hypothetical protein